MQNILYKIGKKQGHAVQQQGAIFNILQYTIMEKYDKAHTHIYIKMNHFAVYQKLTQHCKLTIPQ